MFGKGNVDVKINTLIGKGAVLSGDFKAAGSARIDGKVDGNVNVEGTLIVGATGAINGDVFAEAALIGGEIQGDVNVPQRAELTDTAKVLGDITTAIIVIDEHAIFQGKCNMNQEVPDKSGKKKTAKAVKAGKKSAKEAIAEALKEMKEAESKEQDPASERAAGAEDASAE